MNSRLAKYSSCLYGKQINHRDDFLKSHFPFAKSNEACVVLWDLARVPNLEVHEML